MTSCCEMPVANKNSIASDTALFSVKKAFEPIER